MAEHQSVVTVSPEAPKDSEYMHDGRLKIVIAGLDQNIRAQAIDAADARLEQETNQKDGLKGWIKNRIWKGVLFRDSYRQKYESEAVQDILRHQNLLHHHGVDSASYERATTLRLMHDYEEMRHGGERRRTLGESNDDEATHEQDDEFKDQIFRLIEDYASDRLDNNNFQEAKKRLLKEKAEQGFDKNVLGSQALTADNLLQIAQNVKAMVAYRVATGQGGIEEIWKNTDVIVGDARVGARTDVHRGWTERAADKLKSKKGDGLVNEAVIGAATSLALTGIGRGAKAAGVGASGLILGTSLAGAGLAAGAAAGMFENRVLKQERGRHMRGMAADAQGEELDKRRIELEATRYETRTVSELTTLLGGLYDRDQLKISDQGSYHRAMDALAEVQARIQISDERGIDLISFSGIDKMEQERFDLDLALAKAKCDIKRALRESEDSKLQAIAEYDPLNPNYLDAKKGLLGGEIDQKDRLYNKLRNSRVAKAALKATIVTAATGGLWFVGEEIASHLKGRSGLVDSATKLIKKNISAGKFTPPNGEVELSGDVQSVDLGEYAKLNLPEEFQLTQNQDGTLTVVGPAGFELNGITLKEDGHLTSQSEQLLRATGFEISADNGPISIPEQQSVEVSGSEFVENHSAETTEVSRDAWWENQTSTPDGTELGLQTPEIDSDGNIVITMNNLDMTATSSMVDGEASLRELAASGELKVAISASTDTQAQVFMFDMNADGQAVIPPDHPVAKSLFDQDGNFQGGFIEVVQETEKDSDGVSQLHVFATVVGPDTNSLQDTIATAGSHAGTVYNIEYNPSSGEAALGPDLPGTSDGDFDSVSPPLATSIYGRRGLGSEGVTTNTSEVLTPISELEARNRLERMKIREIYKAELYAYKGWLMSMGPPIGGQYLFARVDKAGKQLFGKPVFIALTTNQTVERLREGRLKAEIGP